MRLRFCCSFFGTFFAIFMCALFALPATVSSATIMLSILTETSTTLSSREACMATHSTNVFANSLSVRMSYVSNVFSRRNSKKLSTSQVRRLFFSLLKNFSNTDNILCHSRDFLFYVKSLRLERTCHSNPSSRRLHVWAMSIRGGRAALWPTSSPTPPPPPPHPLTFRATFSSASSAPCKHHSLLLWQLMQTSQRRPRTLQLNKSSPRQYSKFFTLSSVAVFMHVAWVAPRVSMSTLSKPMTPTSRS